MVIAFGDEDKIIWWKNNDGMSMSLPDFPAFDTTDSSTAGPRWKKWIERFDNLMLAMNIKDSDDEKARKKALLLHYMGGECFDIYTTLRADDDTFAGVKKKMEEYFVPQANTEYERYVFRSCYQTEGETLRSVLHPFKEVGGKL